MRPTERDIDHRELNTLRPWAERRLEIARNRYIATQQGSNNPIFQMLGSNFRRNRARQAYQGRWDQYVRIESRHIVNEGMTDTNRADDVDYRKRLGVSWAELEVRELRTLNNLVAENNRPGPLNRLSDWVESRGRGRVRFDRRWIGLGASLAVAAGVSAGVIPNSAGVGIFRAIATTWAVERWLRAGQNSLSTSQIGRRASGFITEPDVRIEVGIPNTFTQAENKLRQLEQQLGSFGAWRRQDRNFAHSQAELDAYDEYKMLLAEYMTARFAQMNLRSHQIVKGAGPGGVIPNSDSNYITTVLVGASNTLRRRTLEEREASVRWETVTNVARWGTAALIAGVFTLVTTPRSEDIVFAQQPFFNGVGNISNFEDAMRFQVIRTEFGAHFPQGFNPANSEHMRIINDLWCHDPNRYNAMVDSLARTTRINNPHIFVGDPSISNSFINNAPVALPNNLRGFLEDTVGLFGANFRFPGVTQWFDLANLRIDNLQELIRSPFRRGILPF